MLLLDLSLLARLLMPHGWAPCDHTPTSPAPMSTAESRRAVADEIRSEVTALGGSPRFAAYLVTVAMRESSLRPGVIHVIDSKHASAAYRRLRASHRARRHPLADRPEIWLSYGLFGMNSNYHADKVADPRELCTVRGAVTVYAEAARSAIRRMPSACGVTSPTWGDIHRAIQGGDLCPRGELSSLPTRMRVPLVPGDLGS
jgi:hypothetical protein